MRARRLEVYPGSPAIALRLMRAQDTLIANELHPEELARLKAAIGADRRAKVMALDAWVALKSLLPPKERRGIVLIDPPFEEARELDRMVEAWRRACSGSPPASIWPGILSRTRSRSPAFTLAWPRSGCPSSCASSC